METLKEQLWTVAKEYARQFGEIIGMEPEHCVGDIPSDMWCFGDTMFFSLVEMQMVVDNIDKYTKRYGDKATVGYEIHDWVNLVAGLHSSRRNGWYNGTDGVGGSEGDAAAAPEYQFARVARRMPTHGARPVGRPRR